MYFSCLSPWLRISETKYFYFRSTNLSPISFLNKEKPRTPGLTSMLTPVSFSRTTVSRKWITIQSCSESPELWDVSLPCSGIAPWVYLSNAPRVWAQKDWWKWRVLDNQDLCCSERMICNDIFANQSLTFILSYLEFELDFLLLVQVAIRQGKIIKTTKLFFWLQSKSKL
jgi:hypothetical protein